MDDSISGVLRAGDGRLRLGWRLSLFMVLALATMLALVSILPAHLLSGSVGMLAGGLVGGWTLLALDGRGPGSLGFYASRDAVPETAKGLGLGVALGLSVVAFMALLGGLRWAGQPGTVVGWATDAVGALAFLAVPAAAEEAVLRGYLLQALAEAWGPLWALSVTSIAFAALHVGNPGLTTLGVVNVTAAGAFLGVVYLKTGSLWWATGAHLGWNFSHGYLADVPVSGLELLDAPFYEGVSRGADWLGGGLFGPEGSAVSTVLVVGAAVWCWRAGWLGPSQAALDARPLALVTCGLGEREERLHSGKGGVAG